MFTDYSDITTRIAERPKWWDEQRVPRYAEFHPCLVANIYAIEAALVEIACSCGDLFAVAFSYYPAGFEGAFPESIHSLAEAIEKGEIHYGDPPNYGNCQSGPSMNPYDLRVLQYWSRGNEKHTWIRDSRLEIDLPDMNALPEWRRRN